MITKNALRHYKCGFAWWRSCLVFLAKF
jgi:hypothetical protein